MVCDIYFSFAQPDAHAVLPLIEAIKSRGVSVFAGTSNVVDAESILSRIVQELAESRLLVAWFSENYNKSRVCQWEITAAILARNDDENEGFSSRLAIISNEELGRGTQISELREVLFLQSTAGDTDRLADAIVSHLKIIPPTSISAVTSLQPPPWYGQRPSILGHFDRPEPLLWRIHIGLTDSKAMALIQGPSGIGKSSLVAEYALRFGSAYPGGVFWLSAARSEGEASNQEKLDRQCFDLALSFELSVPDGDPVAVKALVRDYLAELPAYLWVVDSLPSEADEDLLSLWKSPTGNGHSLVTMCGRGLDKAGTTIALDVLGEEEALERLTVQKPPGGAAERTAARMIAKILGFHDLAIDVAGAMAGSITYRQFLDMLRAPGGDALQLAQTLTPELAPGHYGGIAATLLRAVNGLAPEGKRLLQLTSLLAPAPIPLDFLLRVLDALDGKEATSGTLLAKGVNSVTATALAQSAENSLIVHALVSHTIRFYDPASEDTSNTVTAVLNTIMASAEDANAHANIEHLIPHVRIVTENLRSIQTVRLLGWLALFDFVRGALALSEINFRRQWEALVSRFGEEHLETLAAMSNLISTLAEQGNVPATRALLERSLSIHRQEFGEEHPRTLKILASLAGTLIEQGKLDAAEKIINHSLKIHYKVLGEDNPDTLTMMNSLVVLYFEQGNLTAGRAMGERVLAARRRVSGEDHPGTIIAMSNFAKILREQGDLYAARDLQERGLEVFSRIMGQDHVYTLDMHCQLARTVLQMGDIDLAHKLAEAAWKRLRHLPSWHHWRTWIARGIVSACAAAAGNAEGVAGMNSTIELLKSRFHPNHREVRWLEARLAEFRPPPPPEPLTIDPLRLAFLLVLNGKMPSAQLASLSHPEVITQALDTLKIPGQPGAAWLERAMEHLNADKHHGAQPDALWRSWMERVNGAAVDRLRSALEIYASSAGPGRHARRARRERKV
jgi:hypothetical protein